MTEEKTPERIVLPRSGLVLRLLERDVVFGDLYRADIPAGAGLRDRRGASSRLPSSAWCGDVDGIGSLDECIAWLDARVLSLRSAMLAGAEETVTRAIGDAVGDDGAAVTHAEIARAVLAALCGEASK